MVADSTPFSNSALVSCEISDLTEALTSTEALKTKSSSSYGGLARAAGEIDHRTSRAQDVAWDPDALTIMVCCYDEDAVGDFELTVYSNYPLVAADADSCGFGLPGETLIELGPEIPVIDHDARRANQNKRWKNQNWRR